MEPGHSQGDAGRTRPGAEGAPCGQETELWRMRKGERELQCVAVYLTTGIDLRLLEAGEIRRTERSRLQWRVHLRFRCCSRCDKRRGSIVRPDTPRTGSRPRFRAVHRRDASHAHAAPWLAGSWVLPGHGIENRRHQGPSVGNCSGSPNAEWAPSPGGRTPRYDERRPVRRTQARPLLTPILTAEQHDKTVSARFRSSRCNSRSPVRSDSL